MKLKHTMLPSVKLANLNPSNEKKNAKLSVLLKSKLLKPNMNKLLRRLKLKSWTSRLSVMWIFKVNP
jgi:hypothetical protein